MMARICLLVVFAVLVIDNVAGQATKKCYQCLAAADACSDAKFDADSSDVAEVACPANDCFTLRTEKNETVPAKVVERGCDDNKVKYCDGSEPPEGKITDCCSKDLCNSGAGTLIINFSVILAAIILAMWSAY